MELQSKLRSVSVSEDLRAMPVIMQLIGENRGVNFRADSWLFLREGYPNCQLFNYKRDV